MNARGILLSYDFPPGEGGIQTLMRDVVTAPSGVEWRVVARQAGHATPESVRCPVTRIALRPQQRLRDRAWLRMHPRASVPDLLSHQAGPTLLRQAREHKATFLFADQLWCATAVRDAAQEAGLPWGLWVHGKELLHASPETRSVLSRAGLVLACSEFTGGLAVTSGARKERVAVVWPGVDTERFRPCKDRDEVRSRLGLDGQPALLTVAHLVPRKGHALMLHAIAGLRARGIAVQFLMVGKGSEEGSLRGLVRELKLSEAVRFCGCVLDRHLPHYYGAVDLHVMPSLQDGGIEGFGIAFIEAAACGTPSIGSSSGGIPDAVVQDVTGCLVPAGDPNALADCIQGILNDPARLGRLRRSARQAAIERFSAAIFTRRLTSVFEERLR